LLNQVSQPISIAMTSVVPVCLSGLTHNYEFAIAGATSMILIISALQETPFVQAARSMQHIRRILVAIKDPKARSSPAIVKAAQLAHACGADLELFHVGRLDAVPHADVSRTSERFQLHRVRKWG
jgi:hypothetical protein